MKRTLTDKDGNRCTIDGRRDRYVMLPGLDECRKWWCANKFMEGWGMPLLHDSAVVGSMIPHNQ